jgi:hypothetical protein
MKRARSVCKKRLALVFGIIMLVGLLPFSAIAAEAAPGVSILAEKDSKGVTANIYDFASKGVDVHFIFAVYEANGKLNYIKEALVTVAAGASYGTQRFDFDIAAHPDYIVRVFAWDRLSLIPIEVTDSFLVAVDELKKTGAAYKVTQSGNQWAYTRAADVDVVIAYKPRNYIGGSLPDLDLTYLRRPTGVKKVFVIVSL